MTDNSCQSSILIFFVLLYNIDTDQKTRINRMKISAVYKITNTVTGDFYIGSSKDVKKRWTAHKCPSTWKKCPNNPLYKDMEKFGVNSFVFEVIAEVEEDSLKEAEQQFIEALQPTYNNYMAKGKDIERHKESHRKANKEYQKTEKFKKYQREYKKTKKGKESHRKAQNKYNSQLCLYNSETLTLNTLAQRFRRAGMPNPTAEAKKYLLNK